MKLGQWMNYKLCYIFHISYTQNTIFFNEIHFSVPVLSLKNKKIYVKPNLLLQISVTFNMIYICYRKIDCTHVLSFSQSQLTMSIPNDGIRETLGVFIHCSSDSDVIHVPVVHYGNLLKTLILFRCTFCVSF